MNSLFDFLNGGRWREWVPVPIRTILGVGFMVHGWAKWNRGPAAFAELLKQARVPLPFASAWLVTVARNFWRLSSSNWRICRPRKYSADLFDVGRDVYRKHQVRV